MAHRLAFTQSLPITRLSFRRATCAPSPLSSVRTYVQLGRHSALSLRHGPVTCMSTTPTPPPPTQTPPPASAPSSNPPPSSTPQTFPITLLYDGECPLCVKEINFLRNRQSRLNLSNLQFTDIANPDYDAASHANIDYETAMGVIHAITADGRIVTGVPVFRLAYEAVGLGWIYAITKVQGVGWLAGKVYNLWASKRLAWTGRADMDTIMEVRRAKVESGCKRGD